MAYHGRSKKSESGIALFMVISAMMVLSLLVTEFTYVVQVNHRMATDGLDSLKAHYLAKSGLKLSMLRLKAYRTLSDLGKSGSGGGAQGAGGIEIPRQILDQIWSLPFFYPIPKDIPGLSLSDRESLNKFEKESTLQGKMVATITSESSKFNLNSILPPVMTPKFAIGAGPTPTPTPNPGAPQAGSTPPTPTPMAPQYDAEKARRSLFEFLSNLVQRKSLEDEEFARDYRGIRMDEIIQQIVTWSDPSSPFRNFPANSPIQPKQGPFYSVSELRFIPAIDDTLYDLFSPHITTSLTSGINVNTMTAEVLRALIPTMTDEDIRIFYEYRDNPQMSQGFKSPDDFFKYLKENVPVFRGSDAAIDEFKQSLQSKGIQLVVNESAFKITVQAQVNNATRLIEAWVNFDDSLLPNRNQGRSFPQADDSFGGFFQDSSSTNRQQKSGLRITFMRIL